MREKKEKKMVLENIKLSNVNTMNFEQKLMENVPKNLNETDIGKLLNGSTVSTEKQKEAREKLYKLVASNGISYQNAKNNIAEIEKKYDKECQSYYEQEQPEYLMVYRMPQKQFDPTLIPDAKDRERYYASIRAMQEIEQNYSALFAETGLPLTSLPDQGKKTNPSRFNFEW